jgi:hypothetical protein
MKMKTCAILLIFSAALSAAPPEVTPGAGARVKFQAYDGNVQTPEKMEFQINSAGGRTSFVKIGEMIEGTKLKLEKFQFKEVKSATGEPQNVSELTVRDTVTGKAVVLALGKVVAFEAPAK